MKTKAPSSALDAKRPGRPPVDRREEILEAAERLYDAIGFDKTTMGDVARELGMSPANLYRSFPNRQALDEAIAERKLSVIEDRAWTTARAGGDPAETLKALSRGVLEDTRRLVLVENRVNQLCAVAAREKWPVVEAYMGGLRGAVRHVIMDGQRAGVFARADAEDLADTVCAALTRIWYPLMIQTFSNEDLPASSDRICTLLSKGMSI